MYEFDRCQVANTAGNIVLNGYITEYDAGIVKIHAIDPVVLYKGEKVTLFILNSQTGESKYSAEVSEVHSKTVTFINAAFLGSQQKRSNTRVNKQIKFTIKSEIKNGSEVPLKKPIKITMLNISAKGMYFNSDENIENGFTFPLEFKLSKRPVHLIVKVIRKEEYSRSNNYGCSFDISQRDMDEIFKFVLKEQIEQRRNRTVF